MSAILTARVSDDVKDQLETLSKNTNRAKSWLVNDALCCYLDTNQWQIEAIQQGLDEALSGDLVSSKQVDEWLQSWGTAGEKAAPKWK